MAVPMMQIRIVRMPMDERSMAVPMAVRLIYRIARRVGVLVVLVMRMTVFVLHRIVRVIMLVALGQMHPQACRHKGTRREEPDRQRLMQQRQRQYRADKGSQREIGTSSRRPEMAQAQYEQSKAYAIAKKADHTSRDNGAGAGQRGTVRHGKR